MASSLRILKKITPDWSLFLDRDGVINKRISNDYVKNIHQMELLPHISDAMNILSEKFGKTFIVTNQQGIGKGLMSHEDLHEIHRFMQTEIEKSGGKIDRIYYAPYLESDRHVTRKPGIGMGLQAKKEFPDIDLKKSVMVGDSISDMIFGKRLGMITVFISDDVRKCRDHFKIIDLSFSTLYDFARSL